MALLCIGRSERRFSGRRARRDTPRSRSTGVSPSDPLTLRDSCKHGPPEEAQDVSLWLCAGEASASHRAPDRSAPACETEADEPRAGSSGPGISKKGTSMKLRKRFAGIGGTDSVQVQLHGFRWPPRPHMHSAP